MMCVLYVGYAYCGIGHPGVKNGLGQDDEDDLYGEWDEHGDGGGGGGDYILS